MLKFENGECTCKEFNPNACKTCEVKKINKLRPVKAKL